MDTVRLDRWLSASRLYKSRSLSQEACTGGLVKLNGENVRPSHLVRAGDEIRAEAARGLVVWVIRALSDKRLSAALAKELYEDRSPPLPPREERIAPRLRGAGRPTKAERRALERFKQF